MAKDIEIDKQDKEGEGIQIEQAKGQIPPPIQEEEKGEARLEAEGITPKRPSGKMPLQPAVIRLAFRTPGELLAYATKWNGWKASEEELRDIVEVWQELNIEMDTRLQALILPVVLYSGKAIGYQAWRKSGRPGLAEKEVGSPHPLEGKTGGGTI